MDPPPLGRHHLFLLSSRQTRSFIVFFVPKNFGIFFFFFENLKPNTDQSVSTTTSGGLMFSSPMYSRRNVSAIEISEMAATTDDRSGSGIAGHLRSEPNLLQTKHSRKSSATGGIVAMLSQQNSVDTASVGSSSVDWSPPDSNVHSRRNTMMLKSCHHDYYALKKIFNFNMV